ncbi:hypothetical protein Tco_0058339 [Tanacetum coccineum]
MKATSTNLEGLVATVQSQEWEPIDASTNPPGSANSPKISHTSKWSKDLDFVVLDIPEDIKVTLILGRPFLSTAHAKIDVFKRKFTLRLKRNQVKDLGPTIEEGEVIDEPIEDIVKTRNDDDEIIAKNIDAYRDEGLGDVIVEKPFCREIYVKAMQFDGMITIYNGNGGVTYQMARSHPRSQCGVS